MKSKISIQISGLVLFFAYCIIGCKDVNQEEQLTIMQEGKVLSNDYAAAFKIIEFPTYKELQIIDPTSKKVDFSYGIGENIPEHLFKIKSGAKRIVAMSSTHIGMLEALDLTSGIVGVSDKKYVCSEHVKKHIDEKGVISMGELGAGDVEAYLAVQPDIILFSGFDLKAPILEKLEKAGKTTFINFDWKEKHPLGRAEWIKVFGLLFQKEQEANAFYTAVKSAYETYKSSIKVQSSEQLVLAGTPYGDQFNAPAGDSYMAQLFKDAGINYIFKDRQGTGSLSLGIEDLIINYGHAAIWLNVNATTTEEVLALNQKFKLMEAFKNNKMFEYSTNVNCFWEQSAVHPDWVLHDLIKIVQPEEVTTPFHFYRKIED